MKTINKVSCHRCNSKEAIFQIHVEPLVYTCKECINLEMYNQSNLYGSKKDKPFNCIVSKAESGFFIEDDIHESNK